ncbi:hypothetical protein ACFQ68_11740 [Amycolatopsis japonica]|uniref:hypothetical protein n=1 Tax=Amycolatopsis japonica TaxID=208439 RepID=UPI0036721735
MKHVFAAMGLSALASLGLVQVAEASPDATEEVFTCAYQAYSYWCSSTLANVNVRTQPNSQSGRVVTLPKNETFELQCWRRGESINGDDVWYYGSGNYVNPWERGNGFVSGYWLATGKDPAPQIRAC